MRSAFLPGRFWPGGRKEPTVPYDQSHGHFLVCHITPQTVDETTPATRLDTELTSIDSAVRSTPWLRVFLDSACRATLWESAVLRH